MRRIFKILAGLTAVALLALLTLPWWLGPVVTGVASHYHATYSRYERLGYGRFALHDVVVDLPTVRVTAKRAETATPVLWSFRRLTGRAAPVTVTNWRVEVKPSAAPAAAAVVATTLDQNQSVGAIRLHAILTKVASGLDRWLPQAEIGAGEVTWPGGGLRLASATWQQRTLAVRQFHLGVLDAEAKAKFSADGTIELEAKSATPDWRTTLKNSGDRITGEVWFWEQPATVNARLPNVGWMPAEADVVAEHWTVPAAKVKLGQFYANIRGDLRVHWSDGKFETSLDVVGDAIPERKAPPLTAKLHGHGDGESLTVESLAVEIPGVSATLSAPAVIDRHGHMTGGASQFSVTADLEKQPWFKAKGRVTGTAQLTPRENRAPLIAAVVNAQDLGLPDWAVARFGATAELDWPRLTVKQADLGFAEGGQLALRGEWNFETKEMRDGIAEGTIHPSLVARWLPAAIGFESVTVSAKANGPLATLAHEGKAHVNGLTVTKLQPLTAEVVWQGKGPAIKVDDAHVQAGASQLAFAGTVDASGAQLTALTLSQGETTRLSLARPASVHWSPKIEIGPLELSGGESSLAATTTAGESGHVNLVARNFSSLWLKDFLALPGPDWRVTTLTADGNWDRGPLTFKAEAELSVSLDAERTAAAALKMHGDKNGVEIESLNVAEGTAPIVTATGRLPITLHPGTTPLVKIEETAPLKLHATTTSNPAFWKKLSETTGLEFEAPEIAVDLSGTWARPQGEVSAKATRLATDGKRFNLPVSSVEALDLHVLADRAGLTLDRFSLKLEGQDVRASGKLAFKPEQWAELKKEPLTFVREQGSLHLEIPDAEFTAIARHFPEFLAQSGHVQIDATFAPGGEMKGSLKLRDAATRPIAALGVFQEIEGEAELAGSVISLKSLTARSGGQPVTITGKIELPLKAAPKYDLTLKGENLPLVRQTGLLVRADVDLRVASGETKTPTPGAPTISGNVKLRDSMYLSDLRAFIPRGGSGPARRPPYFAIEQPPLNAWHLDVQVHGERFMRLRSTLFTGTASARFKIGGTLGAPNMTGEADVDTGTVTLPFATFTISEAAVRITDANPNSLRLAVTGTSRRYGYDLRMEVSGSADAPVVTFSSSPALDAKQVLLMVMAGELPNDEITYGNAQRAARLGTFLGQSLIASFGGDPSDASRLTITTGERVSSLGRETYEAEYRLTDRFKLVGEYDEYDAYNMGVKWDMRPAETPLKDKADAPLTGKKEAPRDQLR